MLKLLITACFVALAASASLPAGPKLHRVPLYKNPSARQSLQAIQDSANLMYTRYGSASSVEELTNFQDVIIPPTPISFLFVIDQLMRLRWLVPSGVRG